MFKAYTWFDQRQRDLADKIHEARVKQCLNWAESNRAFATKFWIEYRLQMMDRLEAMTELGIKSNDPRYEQTYYAITDSFSVIMWLESLPESTRTLHYKAIEL